MQVIQCTDRSIAQCTPHFSARFYLTVDRTNIELWQEQLRETHSSIQSSLEDESRQHKELTHTLIQKIESFKEANPEEDCDIGFFRRIHELSSMLSRQTKELEGKLERGSVPEIPESLFAIIRELRQGMITLLRLQVGNTGQAWSLRKSIKFYLLSPYVLPCGPLIMSSSGGSAGRGGKRSGGAQRSSVYIQELPLTKRKKTVKGAYCTLRFRQLLLRPSTWKRATRAPNPKTTRSRGSSIPGVDRSWSNAVEPPSGNSVAPNQTSAVLLICPPGAWPSLVDQFQSVHIP